MCEPGTNGRGRRAPALACVLAAAAALGGCSDSAASGATTDADDAAPGGPARTVVAVVDFSGSQTSHAVGEAQAYLGKVVEGLSFGDRLVLLEMYRTGSRDSVGRFVQDMPEPAREGAVTSYDRRQLDAARRGVLTALPIFFDPELARSVPTTDVFTTLHMASEHLRDGSAREKELLLLSDMLQSTPRWEFEGARRMPEPEWVAAQEERSLLPALDGACVVVLGADHTTPQGQRVHEFWSEYFAATGARLDADRYRLRPPTDVLTC